MAITLTIVPKSRGAAEASALRTLAASVTEASARFIGPRYGSTPSIQHNMSADGATVMQWSADNEDDVLAIRRGRWAVSSWPKTAQSLLEFVSSRAGHYRYTAPVWGKYMAVIGDRSTDRLFAWNTVPTHEAVHYGEDEDFVFLSNRPLLIALSAARGCLDRIRLNADYVIEYLNFGYSVSGVTPFDKVRVLPPRSALSVVGGVMAVGPAPTTPEIELEEQTDPRRTGAAELATALRNATSRAHDRRYSDRIQLRLSGGVDSRIVLGLLNSCSDISVTAVTHGTAASEDVMVAAQLADAAGIDLVVKHPEFTDSAGFIESLRRSIFESQGNIPSESLVAPYANAAPLESPECLSAGQWPIFKGALDKTVANGLDHVRERIMQTSHGNLRPEYNAACSAALHSWLATVNATTNIEVLYAHARDFRSGRYLQAHNIQADRQSQVLYPFIDSEVGAVADVLPTVNRIQNTSAFLALSEIWEDAIRVPLAGGGSYRFEAVKPMEGISGRFFEDRKTAPKPYSGIVLDRGHQNAMFSAVLENPLVEGAKCLVRSPRWDELRGYLSDPLGEQLEELATMDAAGVRSKYTTRAGRKTISVTLWRCVLVDLWLERRWLTLSA